MKRIVLKVVQQCVATAGVEPEYIRTDILPEFFRNFWIRRMALDRRNYNQVIETTEELANKVGCSDVIGRIVDDLKDDSEPYRRMVMETVNKVLQNLGASDIDERLEERLIDGILYAFQEQAVDASNTGSNSFGRESQVMLDGFGRVVTALGERWVSNECVIFARNREPVGNREAHISGASAVSARNARSETYPARALD